MPWREDRGIKNHARGEEEAKDDVNGACEGERDYVAKQKMDARNDAKPQA
jgi:hypothetical protein